MRKVEFHKRTKEENIRKINLISNGKCIKVIDFSDYQLFQILSDVVEMFERGDSQETIKDYLIPFVNLHSTDETINLDELTITDGIKEKSQMIKDLERSNTRQAKLIENSREEIEKLKTEKLNTENDLEDVKKSESMLLNEIKELKNKLSEIEKAAKKKDVKNKDDYLGTKDIDEILDQI